MLYTPTTDNYNKLRHVSLQLNLKAACPHPHTRVQLYNRYVATYLRPLLPIFQSLIRLLRVPSSADKASWMACLKERTSGSFRKKHGERVRKSSLMF